MTSLHLYCIVPAPHGPPQDLTGLGGARVRLVEAGAIAAWVTDVAGRVEAAAASIRGHHRVVVAAQSATVTPVPVRFGESARDDESLRNRLNERESEYVRLLEHVAGAVEYGVRLFPVGTGAGIDAAPPATVGGPGAGRAYMEFLARREAVRGAARERAELVARVLREAVPDGIRDERREIGTGGGTTSNVLHLVDLAEAERYRDAVGSALREFADLRFVLTGPWPPYSFVA